MRYSRRLATSGAADDFPTFISEAPMRLRDVKFNVAQHLKGGHAYCVHWIEQVTDRPEPIVRPSSASSRQTATAQQGDFIYDNISDSNCPGLRGGWVHRKPPRQAAQAGGLLGARC